MFVAVPEERTTCIAAKAHNYTVQPMRYTYSRVALLSPLTPRRDSSRLIPTNLFVLPPSAQIEFLSSSPWITTSALTSPLIT